MLAAAAMGLAVGIASTVLAVRAARADARNSGTPGLLRSLRDGVFGRDTASVPPSSAPVLSTSGIDHFSHEVDATLASSRLGADGARAQRRLLEVLMAGAIMAERSRAGSTERPLAEPDLATLQRALGRLMTPVVVHAVDHAFRTNAAVLDDDAAAIFERIFGAGRAADGAVAPLRAERLHDALRLADPQPAPRSHGSAAGSPGAASARG